MGLRFGELAKIRGIIYYRLSPFEQRAFAGLFTHSLPNLFRRIRSQIFVIVPPFVVGYMVYDWGEKEHERLMRKQPADVTSSH
ncbi:ubiquinol-cytochrome c reductase ubiquinone-binding protein [Tachypleus tridentatus]|uniref:ubiquinol-cytochrome c reductase ubiquinone-binding protein n=1 Tax=Tachypleus tridentatus TaxID=6853 RepID=UPI003FD12B34